ncbi:family 43 glycosylhydrolase [Paenibacillus hamazuiensis]|uniref:family 43 glycosylhydrolase n=1 Tax=Paenibacillus hamazuiensis TaxID=2936508 RepID=UPI00200F7B2D|nr:family 43 glycosylhydrolase [Paenibacillus hamazuiensis]
MLKRVSLVLIALLCLASFGPVQDPSQVQASIQPTFTNPIKYHRSADPDVFRASDGNYYLIQTEGRKQIVLRRAKSMVNIMYGDQKTVYRFPSNEHDIWAPEIRQFDGVWYIYYSSLLGSNGSGTRRNYVLKNTSPDPFTGTWTYVGKVTDSTDEFALDSNVFQVNGQYYITWSGWNGSNHDQHIYIASMSNPYTINSARTLIAAPTQSWERATGVGVCEGPSALVKNGNVYISYSGSQNSAYSMGLLTASASGNLLDASSWTKTGPVFQAANGITAPGHNGWFKSTDGTEDWFIFHGNNSSGIRSLRIQKVIWNGNTPNFGVPEGPNTILAIPSGDNPTDRYQAEDATVSGAVKTTFTAESDFNGFSGTGYVKFVNNSGDSIQFTVTAAAAGTYNLLFRYTNDTSTSTTLKLTVNGVAVNNALGFISTGNGTDNWGDHYWNYTRSTQTVTLNAGTNTIKLETNGNGGPWIDSLIIAKP